LQTIDEIVGRLDATNGRFSELLNGIISSAAFQKQRNSSPPARVTLAPAVPSASALAAQTHVHP